MSKSNQRVARFLVTCGILAAACAPVLGQKQQQFDTRAIYDSIDCRQWTQNADGTWDGGPNARVGSMTFHATIHNTMSGYTESGVDAEAVLLKKCAKH
jgi:hypothetical protein